MAYIKFYYLINTSNLFLIFPMFYSGCITHKKIVCLSMNSIIFIIHTYILIFINSSYIDSWLLIISSLLIVNYKLELSQYLAKLSENSINLNAWENRVYNKHFSSTLLKEEFKYLFDKGKKISIKARFNFCKEGELFDKLIFFVTVSEENTLCLSCQNNNVAYVQEGQWVGVVDFFNYHREAITPSEQKWNFSLSCEKDNIEICYYEWKVKDLRNIFRYSNNNVFINKLLLLWAKNCSENIAQFNTIITELMNEQTPRYERKENDEDEENILLIDQN